MEPVENSSFTSQEFRSVLGHFPTGVTVITSMADDGEPLGMVVGSFTSVSLDPPLVAFLPAKSSSTFPKIRESGRFCVNVLASDQEHVCRAFARSGGPKFEDITFVQSPGGSPIIEGVVAWIDCVIESITEAGDHEICVGRVRNLEVASSIVPLLFFRGGYGGFASQSLAAPAEADLVSHLRVVDHARTEMERLVTSLKSECIVSALVGDSIVMMAVAGTPSEVPGFRVGHRMPFIPPVGPLFAAWADETEREAWLNRLPLLSEEQRTGYRSALGVLRERGFAVGRRTPLRRKVDQALVSAHADVAEEVDNADLRRALERLAKAYDPSELAGTEGIEYVGAPIFDANGRMVLQLTAYGLPLTDIDAVTDGADQVLEACARVTRSLGGEQPAGRP